MATYSRPGVFVNQSLTPLTASAGGATGGSVACFVGAYNIGPVTPTFVTSWQNYVNLFGGFNVANASPLAYAVWQYFNNGGSGCYVYRVPNTDAAVASLTVGSVAQASGSPVTPDLLTFTAKSPGAWANTMYVEIVPGSSSTDGTSTFTLNIYNGGTAATNLVETWPSVSLSPSSARNLVSLVNASTGGSNYVTVTTSFGSGGYSPGTGDSDPAGNAGSPTNLSGGADGSTAPALDTAITTGISGTGWNSPGLSGLSTQVINVNIPSGPVSSAVAQSVINNVISWAETQGNVFVVIDAPPGTMVTTGAAESSSSVVASYQQYLTTGGTVIDQSPVAAMYGPWLSIQDPASSSPIATKWVAPGGAILGVWSRSDAQNTVAQTPAGTTALVSCVGLEAYFTPADLSNLTTYQVNPVKQVPGTGFVVFGGRTLATGYPNMYINVSRTLLQFTTDFINITQFAIFQNNDATLWQSITNVLTNYLMQAMQNNMLAGTTPETAFQVTCDATTTSPAQAQAGIVNATVAVALVSPAEFIIINLSQMSSGTSTATVSS